MNETLRAVIIELKDHNVRDHQIDLCGVLGLFPDDCFDGSGQQGAIPINLRIGKDVVKTDIDKERAVFRESAAISRFFVEETISEGDLIVIERLQPREFQLWKASKRGFKYYL